MRGDAGRWSRQIARDNHAVELAQAQAERLHQEAHRARLDRIPDPTLSAHYALERGGLKKIGGVTLSIPIPGSGRRA